MGTITTKDGTSIFYKDWGKGQPIVFSHGWPLSSDNWDAKMLFFGQQGYRALHMTAGDTGAPLRSGKAMIGMHTRTIETGKCSASSSVESLRHRENCLKRAVRGESNNFHPFYFTSIKRPKNWPSAEVVGQRL